jgi:hypothetical protein
MLDPRCLDFTISQVQGSVGLTRMSDPIRLDLAVNQVQDNYHSPLAYVG